MTNDTFKVTSKLENFTNTPTSQQVDSSEKNTSDQKFDLNSSDAESNQNEIDFTKVVSETLSLEKQKEVILINQNQMNFVSN